MLNSFIEHIWWKKSAFAERNIWSLKNIFYKYLEEKSTYSNIDQPDQIFKTFNSRANWVTKVAPNKFTKKDAPRFVSLSAQTCSRREKRGENRFTDEFTVHDISSASMEIFGSNTLSSFRNFFNDEIQLAGDWRVPLSEIIFPTKIEHVVYGDMVVYSLKEYEDSQKKATEVNVISRPYNGEKCLSRREILTQWLTY